MSRLLRCCPQSQPYIGVDPQCGRPACICLLHSPHCAPNGVFHNMIPLAQFRHSLNELKFGMADKVGQLCDQFADYMDGLLQEITDLKARKLIELGTLWMR
jgi:hypothetical protein